MDIAVDFDGTCVTHEFPKVGKTLPYAVETLTDLVDKGHHLILFTMRSDRTEKGAVDNPEIADVYGNFLQDAIDWFKKYNIPLYGIQKNPQQGWTTSPKAYAHLYIDDAALGCPLIYGMHNKPYADWYMIRKMLQERHII